MKIEHNDDRLEVWTDVYEDPNYEVNNFGEVRNKETGRMLTPQLNYEGGYHRVTLSGGRKQYVHRIVASSFLAFDDYANLDVNHKDGNKLNNNINNLEWCTRKENLAHASKNGLLRRSYKNIEPKCDIVYCRECRDRYEYEFCDDKPGNFYCAYGRR